MNPDIETMQASVTIDEFIEFFGRAYSMAGGDSGPEVSPEDVKQMVAAMQVIKVVYMANLMVKNIMKASGVDPNELDQP